MVRVVPVCRAKVAVCLAALTSCGMGNEQGDLSAEKTGQIITTLAQRQAPAADLVAGCGDGSLTQGGADTLTRTPFLQQVTSQSATVVFRVREAAPVRLVVRSLHGAPLQQVTSQPDPTVADGKQQLVRLDQLAPNTTYCYELDGLTASTGFRTAPAPDSAAPVRFVAFGDSGSASSDQVKLREQLGTVPFDFMLHVGDLAYEYGTASQLDRAVFKMYAPLMKNFALFPISGNHDYETEGGAPFFSAFVLPENGDAQRPERYYSFDWGNVHFVGLDTEQISTQQAAWLDADLSRNSLPWTIVFAHKPPFSSGEHGSDGNFRKHFVPVLERHKVPLVLSGHEHDYERTKVLNGVTYIVTGGGGIGTRSVGHSSFTAFSEAVIHMVFVEVVGGRLVLHAIDGVGREFDQTVIERA